VSAVFIVSFIRTDSSCVVPVKFLNNNNHNWVSWSSRVKRSQVAFNKQLTIALMLSYVGDVRDSFVPVPGAADSASSWSHSVRIVGRNPLLHHSQMGTACLRTGRIPLRQRRLAFSVCPSVCLHLSLPFSLPGRLSLLPSAG